MGLLDNIANTLVQDVDKLLGVTPKPLSPGQKFVQQVNAIGPIYPAPSLTPQAYAPPAGQVGLIYQFDLKLPDVTSKTQNYVVNIPGKKLFFRKQYSLSTLRFDIIFVYQGTTFTIENVAPGDTITVPFESFTLIQSPYILQNLYDIGNAIDPTLRQFDVANYVDCPRASFLIFQDANYEYKEPSDSAAQNGQFVQLGAYVTNPATAPTNNVKYVPVKGLKWVKVVLQGRNYTSLQSVDIYPYWSLWVSSARGSNTVIPTNPVNYAIQNSSSSKQTLQLSGAYINAQACTFFNVEGFDGYVYFQVNNTGTTDTQSWVVYVYGVL